MNNIKLYNNIRDARNMSNMKLRNIRGARNMKSIKLYNNIRDARNMSSIKLRNIRVARNMKSIKLYNNIRDARNMSRIKLRNIRGARNMNNFYYITISVAHGTRKVLNKMAAGVSLNIVFFNSYLCSNDVLCFLR